MITRNKMSSTETLLSELELLSKSNHLAVNPIFNERKENKYTMIGSVATRITETENNVWISSVEVIVSKDSVESIDGLLIIRYSSGEDRNGIKRFATDVQIEGDDNFTLVFNIDMFCENLRIASYTNQCMVHKVAILGWDVETLTHFAKLSTRVKDSLGALKLITLREKEDIDLLAHEKNRLSAHNSDIKKQIKLLQNAVDERVEFRDNVQKEIDSASQQRDRFRDDVSVLQQEIYEQRISLTQSEVELTEKRQEIDEHIEAIVKLDSSLKEYQKKESLYSEHYVEFKQEIKNQNLKLIIGFIILIIGGFFTSFQVFESSREVVSEFNADKVKDIFNLFLSRLPLLSINVILLGFCAKYLGVIINEYISNNRMISDIRKVEFLVMQAVNSEMDAGEENKRERIRQKAIIIREYLNEKRLDDYSKPKSENKASVIDYDSLIKSLKELSNSK